VAKLGVPGTGHDAAGRRHILRVEHVAVVAIRGSG
jgi:hypothetical protein